jgi:hypothetical protein
MKSWMMVLIFVVFLTGCSSTPAGADTSEQAALPLPVSNVPAVNAQADATPTVETSGISTEFEDAASLRNQLALGILKLEGTDQAITSEQASEILPLWQALLALSGSSTTVQEELSAVQNQIIESLKPEQLEAISSFQITNTVLNDFYAEKGIVMPTPEPGVTKVPGAMKNLSQEDKQATRTAREASGEAGSGTGQITKTLLYEEVIDLLVGKAAK